MTVVKKYLSFRELKDRINNESFQKSLLTRRNLERLKYIIHLNGFMLMKFIYQEN